MGTRSAAMAIGLFCWLLAPWAWAGGGAVQFMGATGPYRVAVFTTPTPARTGQVDVSVLVQSAAGRTLVPQARVRLTIAPVGHPGQAGAYAATSRAASNRLLRACTLLIDTPGRWAVHLDVTGPAGHGTAHFQMLVAPAHGRWWQLAGWVGWPLVPILLFVASVAKQR